MGETLVAVGGDDRCSSNGILDGNVDDKIGISTLG